MTGLRTRGGLGVGHNLSVKHPDGTWKLLGTYPPRTNLFPNPAFTATRAGGVVATNLLNNPGAETATGWSSNNGALYSAGRDTTTKRSGTQSCVMANINSTTVLGSIFNVGSSAPVAVTVSRWYTFSCWVMTNETSASSYIYVNWLDSGSVVVSTSTSTTVALTPGVWTKISVSGAAPANTVTGRTGLSVTKPGATAGMKCWADDACLQEGAPPSAEDNFDGNTAASADYVYAWTGVANQSTSTKSAKNFTSAAVGNTWPVASTAWAGHQSVLLRSTYAVSNASGYYEVANDTGTGAITTPLQRGVTYTASCRVYVDPSNPVTYSSGTGLNYSETGTPALVLADFLPVGFSGERNLSLTFTVNTNVGVTSWRLRLYNGHISGALNVWFDDLIIEANPPAVTDSVPRQEGKNWCLNPYFDVDTNNWVVGSQAVLTRDTAEYHSALASMKAVLTRPGGDAWYGSYFYFNPVTPGTSLPIGTQLRWRVWIKASRSGVIQVWPVRNSGLISGLDPVSVNVTTAWQEVVINWTNDVVVTSFYLIVGCKTETTNITVYIDDVNMTTLVPAYFDGNTADNTDYQYNWTGAVDASTSSATYP